MKMKKSVRTKSSTEAERERDEWMDGGRRKEDSDDHQKEEEDKKSKRRG